MLWIFCWLLMLAGCKGTEDYLEDLHNIQKNPRGHLPLDIYDAGQLAHEAFSALSTVEVMSLSQVGRSVAAAGRAVDRNEVPLLRAEAVSLLGRLALRYPIPPVNDPLAASKDVRKTILREFSKLRDVVDRLTVGRALIPLLGSPDQADVERAYHSLKKITGKDLGRDAQAWERWWQENKSTFETQVSQDAHEPLRTLAKIRYPTLQLAHLVLTLIAYSVAIADLPELRQDISRATLSIGRQVVEQGIIKALEDKSPMVKAEAALAAARVLSKSFGPVLASSLATTRDPDARVRIIRALKWYPPKGSMQALLLMLGDAQAPPAVVENARQTLVSLAGDEMGDDFRGWMTWWDREGKLRWP